MRSAARWAAARGGEDGADGGAGRGTMGMTVIASPAGAVASTAAATSLCVRIPSDPIKRRRLTALLTVAGVALAGGAAVGAGGQEASRSAPTGRPPRAIAPAPGRPAGEASPGERAGAATTGAAASSAGGLRSPAVREAGATIVVRFAGTVGARVRPARPARAPRGRRDPVQGQRRLALAVPGDDPRDRARERRPARS
jgi:hypothetical protein